MRAGPGTRSGSELRNRRAGRRFGRVPRGSASASAVVRSCCPARVAGAGWPVAGRRPPRSAGSGRCAVRRFSRRCREQQDAEDRGQCGQRIRLGARPGGQPDGGPAAAAADRGAAGQAGSGVRHAEGRKLGVGVDDLAAALECPRGQRLRGEQEHKNRRGDHDVTRIHLRQPRRTRPPNVPREAVPSAGHNVPRSGEDCLLQATARTRP